ncbi:DUF3592 domain-containing protein [Streptomyces sp. NPDC002740]
MTTDQWAGCAFAAITGLMCVVLAFETLRRCRLRMRGVRTTAELIRFRTSLNEDGHPRYYPVVSFTLPDGTAVEAESGEGAPSPPYDAKEGDHTEVVYDPASPSSISLPSLEPKRLGAMEILALAAMSVSTGLITCVILAETF